jgi:PadR family transcriptional regulator PadR
MVWSLALQGTWHYIVAVESQSNTVAQLRRGVLEHCVLALLEGEARYAYDLVSDLGDAGLVASEGTVYPLLSRLRRDGLVETVWRESVAGPPRRYYSLTPNGRDSLDAFRRSWRAFRTSVDRIVDGKARS